MNFFFAINSANFSFAFSGVFIPFVFCPQADRVKNRTNILMYFVISQIGASENHLFNTLKVIELHVI